MAMPTQSMTGSSALVCFEAAPHALQTERRAKRIVRVAAPGPEDALKPGTCANCGLLGVHTRAAQCIGALRDRLAEWEIKADAKAKPKAAFVPTSAHVRRKKSAGSVARALDRLDRAMRRFEKDEIR